VCACTCVCVCVCVCVSCVCIQVCVHAHVYMCVFVYVCMCVHTYIHIQTRAGSYYMYVCCRASLPVFPSFYVASTRLMSLARVPAPALYITNTTYIVYTCLLRTVAIWAPSYSTVATNPRTETVHV